MSFNPFKEKAPAMLNSKLKFLVRKKLKATILAPLEACFRKNKRAIKLIAQNDDPVKTGVGVVFEEISSSGATTLD